jgi:hypothetical protein
MTDLEMVRLCAEAMGYTRIGDGDSHGLVVRNNLGHHLYSPLHDDAQAMALVKRFKLGITFIDPARPGKQWMASFCNDDLRTAYGGSDDLNRAIVECVARMSGGTHSGGGR